MSRFLGVKLPQDKRLWIALTEVYGIGLSRAKALCYQIGATPTTKASELRPFHISQLYAAVDSQFTVGNDLRDATRSSIQRLMRIRCYRGIRHKERLPVRGQRTHTNARTQKRRNPPSL
jgi:small subunit ribosomal protein S13